MEKKAPLRNIVTLSVSLHLLACGGRVANHLPPGDESLAEAERLEKKGAFEEASELYLECFASTSCNEAARLTVSTDLKRIADEAPHLEPSIWKAVATAEGRVANASSVTETLTGDLASLIGVYRVWKQPERGGKLLHRLHDAQPAVYNETLESVALMLPDGLTDLSNEDVEHLVSDIGGRAALNAETIRRAQLGDRDKADFEHLRVDTAFAYAVALFKSHHPDAAKHVIEIAVGVPSVGCAAAVAASAPRENSEITTEVCNLCPGVGTCK